MNSLIYPLFVGLIVMLIFLLIMSKIFGIFKELISNIGAKNVD